MRAATALFARRGFEGTTTRLIAERAHVNEAIIFRHFARKDDLYWAIVEEQCQPKNGEGERAQICTANGTDREFFRAIAEDILRRNTEDMTLSRLLLFTALENHRLAHRFFRTYVAEYFDLLAHQIRRRIREGAFRRVDPLLAARGFIGMVTYHFLIQELFGGKRHRKFDSRKVSETLTDIWLQGMIGINRGELEASQ
jgi:AcrR family transcriptional regulator